jgi:hypothetical protein
MTCSVDQSTSQQPMVKTLVLDPDCDLTTAQLQAMNKTLQNPTNRQKDPIKQLKNEEYQFIQDIIGD